MACRVTSIIPFTACALKQCLYDPITGVILSTWKQPVNTVKLVGKIESIRFIDGIEIIMFNDTSGTIAVLYYIPTSTPDDANVDLCQFPSTSNEETTARNSSLGIKENQYVAVYGTVCYMERPRGNPQTHFHIDAKHVQPIIDFNEVTFHMLDVIHTTLIGKAKLTDTVVM